MKRLMLVLVIVALAVPLAAQEKKEVFAFFDSPGGGWSEKRGTTFNTGYGVAFRFFSSEHFSTELAVAERRVNVAVAPDLVVRLRTNPVDLIAAYHFANDSHWKPYLGLGYHYLFTGESGRGYDSRGAAEVAGGVAYHFTPAFFVRGDATLLLRGNNPTYDQRSRGLIGLGWRF